MSLIATKDKNLLLLPIVDGGVTQPFNMPNVSGYDKNKPTHNGIDFGWTKNAYSDILACQDGVVKEVFYNSSVGNAIVLQHDYEDGTHRWTGYIHLKSLPTLKVGASVKQGDKVGIRGGSPYVNGKAKYGVHLHLYVTACNKDSYSWNTMKKHLTLNAMPLLYRSKAVKYNVLVKALDGLKYIEDVRVEVAKPVDRDEMLNQLLEKSSNLRVRLTPSLKGTIIGYLPANVYYNFYDVVEADGYNWYQIQQNPAEWVAQTGTMVVLPHKTEMDLLKEENAKLKSQLETATKNLGDAKARVDLLTERIIAIRQQTYVD